MNIVFVSGSSKEARFLSYIADYLKEKLVERGCSILGKGKLNVFSVRVPENMKKHFSDIYKSGWRIGKYEDLWRFVITPNHEIEDLNLLLNKLDMYKK